MISMSTIHSIRQMRKNGVSIAEIARIAGVSRTTVYAKLADPDLSPELPIKKTSERMLDDYRPVIEGWLDEDAKTWRKQRHTARRIWHRLRDEYGVKCCESTVRHYVAELKKQRRAVAEGFLDLVWNPGEAQADFGEADFRVRGVTRRGKYLTVSFPHANVGLTQVFWGETSECVCQGLRNVFEFVGGVPRRAVFDNATEVGRRVAGEARVSSMFKAFAAHYGLDYTFTNPYSGNEKGSVENAVGFLRRNLMVPPMHAESYGQLSRFMLERCDGLAASSYCPRLLDVPVAEVFDEERAALMPLPSTAFDPVRWESRTADKYGLVDIDSNRYLAGPVFVFN